MDIPLGRKGVKSLEKERAYPPKVHKFIILLILFECIREKFSSPKKISIVATGGGGGGGGVSGPPSVLVA